MTVIVGVEHESGVTIGGDSAAVEDDLIAPTTVAKVFEHGPYLLAYVDSFRLGQILAYRLRVPDQKCSDDLEHLAIVFVDAIRKALTQAGLGKDGEEQIPGALLVGYRRRLYTVESDLAVLRSTLGYEAMGCGSQLALGSLHTTIGLPDTRKRVRYALHAAATHSTGVCPPFTIHTQE